MRATPLFAGLVLLATGCDREQTVRIQLGPDGETLTQGFACRDGDTLLASRALVGDELQMTLVVDLIRLDGFPGCRGEELIRACDAGGCELVRPRFCTTVTVPASDTETLLAALRAQLADEVVTSDAPDGAVLVRAVATTRAVACDALPDVLPPAELVGCAYSCPVLLDEVEGSIALSLDALSDQCAREVEACARFPGE